MPEENGYEGYLAIRNSVALEEETDLHCLLIKGKDAFKILDQICPCNVFLQNGQMKHTLLLDEHAVPFADVYICRKWEDAYLLGYWPSSINMIDWINRHQGSVSDYAIIDLNESNFFLTLNGPYAWELCANAIGPEILGMPYLSIMMQNFGMVFRAGITGEYGYHLMFPAEQKKEWTDLLLEAGKPFDLVVTDRTARAQCTLENFFFDLNREGQHLLTPPELQLQWRLSRQKEKYPGSEAMQSIREKGWNKRLTCFITKNSAQVNDEIIYEKESVGRVISIGYSPLRKEFIGKALIEKPFWHAGLSGFHINNQELETISAPAIDNRSIHVNLNLDSYFTRNENHDESLRQ
ncbi:MAG: aminomethyl transferase family protein [Bacteroidia bacterium]|nr:MAG: aminomethyl transferase family protein [Bacteroidia bacterium]